MTFGVILYGPPASGKDTIADLLAQHEGYEKFKLLRTGSAKPDSYRHIDIEVLEERTDLLWRNDKYNATYAIDKSGIEETLSSGIPIIQLGEPAAIEALKTLDMDWFVVSLWCSRDKAKSRLEARGNVNIADRLKAWDETKSIKSDLDFRTDECAPVALTGTLLSWLKERG